MGASGGLDLELNSFVERLLSPFANGALVAPLGRLKALNAFLAIGPELPLEGGVAITSTLAFWSAEALLGDLKQDGSILSVVTGRSEQDRGHYPSPEEKVFLLVWIHGCSSFG